MTERSDRVAFGMIAKVSERGQVVIPKPLRDRLGIQAGAALEFSEHNGRLIVQKAQPDEDVVGAVYGVLEIARGTDAAIAELRGRVSRPATARRRR